LIGAGAILLAAGAAAQPAAPAAAKRRAPQNTIEVSVRLGVNYVLGAPLPNAMSDLRVGVGGAVRVMVRNRYFLIPFVDGGYSFLSKGSARVPAGEPGGPGVISNKLDAFHVAAGIAFDFWRLRASAGVGVYFFGLDSSFAGVQSSTSDRSIGSILGLSANLYRVPRFHLGANFVSHNAPEAGLNYFLFGFSVHGDVFSW
jgi:hypothetical protein